MSAGKKITPLIAVPPFEDLGPAMQECNEGERAFVIAKIETGESNAECARLAGYSASSPDTLKATGYSLAHRERVQAALLEMSRKLMRTEGAKSIKTLVTLRDDAKVDAKDRIKCAVELLDRAGMAVVQEGHILVEHRLTPAQQDRRILELARELGLSETEAHKMLVDPSKIIEAEFEDVPDGRAGLEDILP